MKLVRGNCGRRGLQREPSGGGKMDSAAEANRGVEV